VRLSYSAHSRKAGKIGPRNNSPDTGNEMAAAVAPLQGTLFVTTAEGVKRINETELGGVSGVGSLVQRINGALGKTSGKGPLSDQLKDDMSKLVDLYTASKHDGYLKNVAYTQKLRGMDPNDTPVMDQNGAVTTLPKIGGGGNKAGGPPPGATMKVAPQLRAVLSKSTARIPASTVTDPIDAGIQAIKESRGVTAQDAQAAIAELQAIKQAALKVPTVQGATATAWAPVEANAVKQEIGQSVNWEGRERVGQLVDPVKRQVYGALKNVANNAAPGSADLNERLTNLLAAQEDVNKLAGFEEVGRGRSMGGVIGPSWMGRLEPLAGRYIPAVSWLAPVATTAVRSTAIPAVTGYRLSDLLR
jgi:hypothetical protein